MIKDRNEMKNLIAMVIDNHQIIIYKQKLLKKLEQNINQVKHYSEKVNEIKEIYDTQNKIYENILKNLEIKSQLNEQFTKKSYKYLNVVIKIRKNDLVNEYSEAIVNPANTELNHAGGAARAISDASGPEFEEDCTKYLEKNKELPTGKAMLTRAGGALCCDRVIHAVGPIYRNVADNSKEEELFKAVILSIMETCQANNILSVSIPAISTGIYRFPLKLAIKLMTKTIKNFIQK